MKKKSLVMFGITILICSSCHLVKKMQSDIESSSKAIEKNRDIILSASAAIENNQSVIQKSTKTIEENGQTIALSTDMISQNHAAVSRSTEAILKNAQTIDNATHTLENLTLSPLVATALLLIVLTPLLTALFFLQRMNKNITRLTKSLKLDSQKK